MKLGDSTARNTKARGKQILCGVASGILPDVEGGILPPGKNVKIIPYRQNPFTSLNLRAVPSAGLEARLHGRPGGPPPLQPVFSRPIQLRN
jgi:hypothetical protein